MPAETAERVYRRPNRDLLPGDGDRRLSVHDHSAQGAMPLVTDEQHRRSGPGEFVSKVVQDSSAGAHAGSRHYQAWARDVVQRPGVVGRGAETDRVKFLTKFPRLLHRQRFFVEKLGMLGV